MTIGELREAIERLDDSLEIEIITPYDDEVDCSFNLGAIETRMDPDTAKEYVRFECLDAE